NNGVCGGTPDVCVGTPDVRARTPDVCVGAHIGVPSGHRCAPQESHLSDSNRGSFAYTASALPTELRWRARFTAVADEEPDVASVPDPARIVKSRVLLTPSTNGRGQASSIAESSAPVSDQLPCHTSPSSLTVGVWDTPSLPACSVVLSTHSV